MAYRSQQLKKPINIRHKPESKENAGTYEKACTWK